jgi:hypothetical protein
VLRVACCGVRVVGCQGVRCGLRGAGRHYSCRLIAKSSKFVDRVDFIGARGEQRALGIEQGPGA